MIEKQRGWVDDGRAAVSLPMNPRYLRVNERDNVAWS